MTGIVAFSHPQLNQRIEAIGGHYVFNREGRLRFERRDVFYLVGGLWLDRSCCGVTGGGYVFVPGFVLCWHAATTADGRPISWVAPIDDGRRQSAIRRRLQKAAAGAQIRFM